ncbi:MAG: TolC family protein [Acidobacteriota bacterium]
MASPAAGQEPAGRTLVLSLEDALRIASGENETIWVAEAGVQRALGSERIVRSQLFPQLNGTAQYIRTLRSQFDDLNFGGDGGGDLPFGRENQYTLGLSLNQLLFDGGRVLSQRRAAEARRRSAEIDVGAAQAQTLLDVTRSYFDAQLADRLVTIAERSLAQSEEILRQTDVARRVGDRSEFELLRARVARDNQLPTLIRRRTARSEAYLRLKQLLNVPPEDNLTLTTGVDEEVPRFAASETEAVVPDDRAPVRQAAENVLANEAQLTEARGQRLPSVSLSSSYSPVAYPANGAPEPDEFQENWTVSVNLSVPILTWGRLRGNEQVAEGNLAEARARLVQTREAAVFDERDARNALADAQATLAGSVSTAEEAARAYSIAQIRFREGIASQIELSDSQLLLDQAEVNRASALRDLQVARARLSLLEDLPLTGQTGSGVASSFQTQQVTTPSTTTSTNTASSQAVSGAPIP